jgi:hypothetical protein
MEIPTPNKPSQSIEYSLADFDKRKFGERRPNLGGLRLQARYCIAI